MHAMLLICFAILCVAMKVFCHNKWYDKWNEMLYDTKCYHMQSHLTKTPSLTCKFWTFPSKALK